MWNTDVVEKTGAKLELIGVYGSYGDAANDPRTTLSESPLRVNAVHHVRTNPANSGRTSLARRRLSASVPALGLASGRAFSLGERAF